MPDRLWTQSPSVGLVSQRVPQHAWNDMVYAYLLVWVHACETTNTGGLATCLSCGLNFLLGTIGEIAGVGVIGHGDRV